MKYGVSKQIAQFLDEEKAYLMEFRELQSKNFATKHWFETLRLYLKQEEMPELEEIED